MSLLFFVILCYNIFRQEMYNLLKLVYTEQLLVVLVIICVKYKNKLNCKVWALCYFHKLNFPLQFIDLVFICKLNYDTALYPKSIQIYCNQIKQVWNQINQI